MLCLFFQLAAANLVVAACHTALAPSTAAAAPTPTNALPLPSPHAGEKVAIKKITNVFDHVSGTLAGGRASWGVGGGGRMEEGGERGLWRAAGCVHS